MTVLHAPPPTTQTAARRRATVRVARWSATHPWRAVGLWLVLVAACIAVGQVASLKQARTLDLGEGQSGRAYRMLHDAGLVDPAEENVLVTARDGRLDLTRAGAALDAVSARLHTLPQVAAVAAPVTSPDGRAVMLEVQLSGDPEDADDKVDPLLAQTAAVQAQYPDLRVEQVGSASLDKAVNDQVSEDLGKAADISLPITVLIMLIAFGAVVAAGVPILLALSCVGAATGLSSLVSQIIPDSGSTSSMILLMGMAVGVDYSLFYVKRARAEYARGASRLDSIEIAAETAGHSVVVAGSAVVASMLGLFLAHNAIFDSLAAGSILVVAAAVTGSLTVLPAVLVLLGRAVDRPRVPLLWRLSTPTRNPRLWPALLRPAVNHPVATLVVSVGALLALASPVLGMTLHSDTPESLPGSIAEVQTLHRLNDAFPGEATKHTVVVEAPASRAASVEQRLHTLAASLDRSVFVDGAAAPVLTSVDGTVHRLDLRQAADAESPEAKDALARLRDGGVTRALAGVPDVRWAVGGDTATSADSDAALSDAIPWVVGFVVALTVVMMGWVFRSVVLALVTAVVNLLSAGVTFGVLVLVFQNHWAQGLLGFRSTGSVINWIPLFTFAVLFGLSMDYHVFVVSHIREAVRAGLPTREAVRVGITRSAGTVTSAAIVMVSVFSIFATMHMIEMKQMGVGLAVAVLIDALVIRIVVLPAILILLGRLVWWPSRTGRAPRPDRDRSDHSDGMPPDRRR